jgi:hypothetical protein
MSYTAIAYRLPRPLRRHILHFALVVASLPFAVAEAACGAGSTVMIEARPR